MGNLISGGGHRREARVLMFGLTGAGKTTILYRLLTGETKKTVETIGFNLHDIPWKDTTIKLWDISVPQGLWHQFFLDVHGVVFVVDAADRARLAEAAQAAQFLMAQSHLEHAPILIYANKSDEEDSARAPEIAEALHLPAKETREWHIQPASGTTGDGLEAGMDWLVSAMRTGQ